MARRSYVPGPGAILALGLILLVFGSAFAFVTFLIIQGKGASQAALDFGGPIAEAVLPLVGVEIDAPSPDGASMMLVGAFLLSFFSTLLGIVLAVIGAALLAGRAALAAGRAGRKQGNALNARLRGSELSIPGFKRAPAVADPKPLNAGPEPTDTDAGDPLTEAALDRSNYRGMPRAPLSRVLREIAERHDLHPSQVIEYSRVTVHRKPDGSDGVVSDPMLLAVFESALAFAHEADDEAEITTWVFPYTEMVGGRFSAEDRQLDPNHGECAIQAYAARAIPLFRLGWPWNGRADGSDGSAAEERDRILAELRRQLGRTDQLNVPA